MKVCKNSRDTAVFSQLADLKVTSKNENLLEIIIPSIFFERHRRNTAPYHIAFEKRIEYRY